MIYFHNDYCEGCHGRILEKLQKINFTQIDGYGTDGYCEAAAELIRARCAKKDMPIYFLTGGTQVNLTVIAAALRPHQAALGSALAHINVHETGAVEATGHKILELPSTDGKITAQQVSCAVEEHYASENFTHTVQPKLVYISHPSELGTLYTRSELEAISAVCRKKGLYLFLDGARLGYALAANGTDVTLADLARLCDVFYIGGTKVGALFGEAVCIPNAEIAADFRYVIKQRGGMLAKGWLLGLQFQTLFEDGLYERLGAHADRLANRIRDALDSIGAEYLVPGISNQIFPVLPDTALTVLSQNFTFSEQMRVDEHRRAVRFCTSWATTPENVEALCKEIRRLRF